MDSDLDVSGGDNEFCDGGDGGTGVKLDNANDTIGFELEFCCCCWHFCIRRRSLAFGVSCSGNPDRKLSCFWSCASFCCLWSRLIWALAWERAVCTWAWRRLLDVGRLCCCCSCCCCCWRCWRRRKFCSCCWRFCCCCCNANCSVWSSFPNGKTGELAGEEAVDTGGREDSAFGQRTFCVAPKACSLKWNGLGNFVINYNLGLLPDLKTFGQLAGRPKLPEHLPWQLL